MAQFAPAQIRTAVEVWICCVGAFVVGFTAWHMTAFTIQTYTFGDLSPGLIAAPLWIPQSAVSFGLIVLFLSILEQLTLVLKGQQPGYATNIDSTAE